MNSKQTEEEKTKVTMLRAPPPWHSVAVVGCMMAVFVSTLPSLASLDKVAKMETFAHLIFPDLVSLQFLAWFRAIVGISMVALQIREVLFGGWNQRMVYLPQSKLQNTTINMYGMRTMMPFTSWSWNVLAASFLLNSYITFTAVSGGETITHPWLLRVAVLLFEVAGPLTLLVAVVVRYAIWPNLLKQGNNDTTELKRFRTLLWHNANVVLALTELGLLGGLPVRFCDFSVAPLFGISYVLFTWCYMYKWAPSQAGPQFIYFFVDTTLGKMTTFVLLALLAVLMVFFGLFAMADEVFKHLRGPLTHALAILLICMLVCRFRD